MPASSSCRFEFVSTDGLPPKKRFAFLRDAALRRLDLYEPVEGGQFSAAIKRLVAPEGNFIELRATSGGLERTPPLCRADGIDDICLTLTLGGDGAGWFGDPDQDTKLDQDGGRLRLRDEGRPYAVRWASAENHTLHVDLPRAGFDRRTRERLVAATGALVSSRGLSPMLAAQMRAFAAIAPGLDPAARAAGLRAVLDLAATVLRLEYGGEPAESEICEDGLLIAAQALICRRFAASDLAPDEIARRLGCSRAHLYRVFARHGLTVAGYLRGIRLERCRAALAAAGPRDTVGDIAFRCGFDNPVHFARLFRERFGMRPSDWRAISAKP